jgi:hypothetical protein
MVSNQHYALTKTKIKSFQLHFFSSTNISVYGYLLADPQWVAYYTQGLQDVSLAFPFLLSAK